jgi:hypothetical protein
MQISKLPEPLRTMANENVRKYNTKVKGLNPNENVDGTLSMGFTWSITPEGFTFWHTVDRGRFDDSDVAKYLNTTINNFQIY